MGTSPAVTPDDLTGSLDGNQRAWRVKASSNPALGLRYAMAMFGFRPKSLSGLMTASLLLLVLPLLLAVGYGALQLQTLTQDSDALVRRSVATTRLTQGLFQDVTAMERAAGLFAVLDDPRVEEAYRTARSSLTGTLNALASRSDSESTASIIGQLREEASQIDGALDAPGAEPGERVQRIQDSFSKLWQLATTLTEVTRQATDFELTGLELRNANSQRWLFWALAAMAPAALLLAIVFGLYVVRPLRQIDRAIAELGSGAFSRPIAVHGPSDLEALGKQLEWLRTRLLEIAQEKDRFLRHMSHELKTPLANIREGTDLLLDGAVGPLDDNQREVATILQDNALKLQRLIENLLSFSARQSQTMQLDVHKFRLPSLVGTVVDSQKLALAARNISLDLDVDEISIVADRAKLKLVVDNLLSNALKFTPRGGTIYIHGHMDGDCAVIDFADSGPGISEADRATIFEAFYTGPAPQAGPLKGTGIGLSVVQEFVQAHGGTIELQQGHFPGAHFRIRLPATSLRQPGQRFHAA